MYALKVYSAKTPAGRAARGAQARRGLDNAAFIRLPLSSCSAGFWWVLLFWRCKAPGKPARPALPAPPGFLSL